MLFPLFVNPGLNFLWKTPLLQANWYYFKASTSLVRCASCWPVEVLHTRTRQLNSLVVTSRHLWVILCPTSYEFPSHFLNLHRLFFCHLEKCQQPVSVGFVRDEACSWAVTFQASLNAKMSLTSPSRQTGCGCFARSGNLISYRGKCWLHHNANITYCCAKN